MYKISLGLNSEGSKEARQDQNLKKEKISGIELTDALSRRRVSCHVLLMHAVLALACHNFSAEKQPDLLILIFKKRHLSLNLYLCKLLKKAPTKTKTTSH